MALIYSDSGREFTSPDFFKINGVSCETVGLYCDSPPVPGMPRRRGESYVTGGDTDAFVPDDSFEDVTYTLRAHTFENTSVDKSAIYAFISEARTLEISRCEDVYFKVHYAEVTGVSSKADGFIHTYSIGFKLAPFKYFTANDWTAPVSNLIVNPGNRYCRPLYRIQGGNNTTLTVNGQNLVIAGGGADYYIDSERMIAYDSNNDNIMPKTTGIFPYMSPGNNIITVTSGSVLVKLNARCW